MASKVTLSLTAETLARARASAEREGLSLSAWMDRAARREALRDAGRQYEQWLDAHPDVRAEVNSWRAATAAAAVQRWSVPGRDEA
jgi:hypothetical protein